MRAMLRLPLPVACAVVCVWISGCATQVQQERVARSPDLEPAAPMPADGQYEAVPAAALVFTPPLVLQEQPLELSRSGRATEAFVGYEQGVTEYHYLRVDDRQRSGDGWDHGWGWGAFGTSGDRYERRAISERIGVRYR